MMMMMIIIIIIIIIIISSINLLIHRGKCDVFNLIICITANLASQSQMERGKQRPLWYVAVSRECITANPIGNRCMYTPDQISSQPM